MKYNRLLESVPRGQQWKKKNKLFWRSFLHVWTTNIKLQMYLYSMRRVSHRAEFVGYCINTCSSKRNYCDKTDCPQTLKSNYSGNLQLHSKNWTNRKIYLPFVVNAAEVPFNIVSPGLLSVLWTAHISPINSGAKFNFKSFVMYNHTTDPESYVSVTPKWVGQNCVLSYRPHITIIIKTTTDLLRIAADSCGPPGEAYVTPSAYGNIYSACYFKVVRYCTKILRKC